MDRFNFSFSVLIVTGQLLQACECLLMISKPKSFCEQSNHCSHERSKSTPVFTIKYHTMHAERYKTLSIIHQIHYLLSFLSRAIATHISALLTWHLHSCSCMLDEMTVGRVQLSDGPIYVPEDSDTAMQAPERGSFLSIGEGSLNPVPLCDLDQVLLKEVMGENRGLTLSDLKKRSPEHLSATLTGCESPDGHLEPAAVKQDADDQLSEIASNILPVDPSCVELKHSAFLAQLLLEEVDLESTSEPTSPVGKPVPHLQHTHSSEPSA